MGMSTEEKVAGEAILFVFKEMSLCFVGVFLTNFLNSVVSKVISKNK